jgi:hypothetical protein
MSKSICLWIVSLAFASLPFTVSAQAPGRTNNLAIGGDVPTALVITPSEFKLYPRASVTVTDEKKQMKNYEGVWLADLLKKAGIRMGSDLRGQNMPAYVLCTAYDGYEVVFSLPEVDPDFADNQVLVADMVDGKPLRQDEGPFRIISPHDKRAARWMRTVQKIDVVRLRK